MNISPRSKSSTLPNWSSRLFVHYTELAIFRESFGLLSSQILLQHFGLRSWWLPYPWYPDIFCHSKTKDWKWSYLSTTNSKNFAVEFALEWVFLLSWKNGVKDTKVYVICVGRQYKPIPIPYQTMQEEIIHLISIFTRKVWVGNFMSFRESTREMMMKCICIFYITKQVWNFVKLVL